MLHIGLSFAQLALTVIVACTAGLVIGLFLSPKARQARQLATQLAEKETELNQYKDSIAAHFVTTAEHFRELTSRYQQLFEHLRQGANQLCDDERIQAHLSNVRVPSKSLLDADVHHVPTSTEANHESDKSGKDNQITDPSSDGIFSDQHPDMRQIHQTRQSQAEPIV